MEEKGEILDIPAGKIQKVNFLDDPTILDVNHGKKLFFFYSY